MKKAIQLVIAILSVLTLTVDARQVNVRGYYRKDGTYVAPHVRNVGGHSGATSSYNVPCYISRPSSHRGHYYDASACSVATPSFGDLPGGEPSYVTLTGAKSTTFYSPRSGRNPSRQPTTYQRELTQGSRNFSKNMKMLKYIEQDGVCPHCQKQFPYNEMEGDHKIPYSKGGKTEYQNLQMLCRPCNRSKGNRYSD